MVTLCRDTGTDDYCTGLGRHRIIVRTRWRSRHGTVEGGDVEMIRLTLRVAFMPTMFIVDRVLPLFNPFPNPFE